MSAPRPRPRIMGVINVTPDSFSDGGLYASPEHAVEHGLRLIDEGAEMIDIGGESTRPGATPVDAEAELERVLPVVRGLAGRGARLSIDTLNAGTAERAVEAGAEIVNDVSGGLADPRMPAVVAGLGVDYVAMHWRGRLPAAGDAGAGYRDVVTEVRAELADRIAALRAAGVAAARIIVDPGLGFSKSAADNWALLGRLAELHALGHPVLVGASRKRFLAEFAPAGAPPADRDAATAVLSALAAEAGVWAVRVHDVAGTRRALALWQRWENGATA
ncbi:MAG: dihydropteroate synthase [Microbacteriaceae bacterium]